MSAIGQPAYPGGYEVMPPKVQAAFEYLRHCQMAQNPQPMFDGCRPESQGLSSKEEQVRANALDVLNRYFTGEDDFVVYGQPPHQPPKDNDPKEKVKV